jgi:hypothetical protein
MMIFMAKKKRLTWKERQLAVARRWAEIMGIDPVTLEFINTKTTGGAASPRENHGGAARNRDSI